MALFVLTGPHALTKKTIDEVVTETSAGVYALGFNDTTNTFFIDYVGRSDNDVNNRLHEWEGKYEQFKFDYFPSAKAAFEKECKLFHDFEPPGNTTHPDRPEDTNWICPRCRIFD
jgi:hypothetical protein